VSTVTDSQYRLLWRRPGAPGIAAWSLLGRLAFAMKSLSLLLYIHAATANLAIAGAAAATNLTGTAVAAVVQGRWFDRYGVGRTLRRLTAVYLPCTALLLILIETNQSAWVLLPVILAQSLAAPLMGVATRAMLPYLVTEGPARDAVIRYWTISYEACYVAAPAVTGMLGALSSPRVPFLTATLGLAAAAVVYAGLPAIRGHRGTGTVAVAAPAVGSRTGMVTLVVAALGFGAVVGFLVLTTVAEATSLGYPHAGGPLFAVMTLCSVVAGILFRTRRREIALPALIVLSAAALLIPIAGNSMVLLLITVAVAGATFAPQLTLQSAILDDMVTRERVGASFGWLTTALALGNAAGQTAGGAISHFAGPNAAAAVGAVTVAAAAVVVAIRRESLRAPSDPGADGALASL